MEPTGPLSRFFWVHWHRNDASASLRWVLSVFLMFALFPGIGSGGSVMFIGLWLFAVLYWIFDPACRILNTTERTLVAVCAAYFLITAGFAIAHGFATDWQAKLGSVYSNVPFLLFAPVLPVLRRWARPDWFSWVFAGIAAGAVCAVLIMLIGGRYSIEIQRAAFSGNPLILALGAMVSGLLCVHGLLFFKGKMRWLMAAGALASLYALLNTGSRGALLSYCLTLAAYGLIMGYRYLGFGYMAKRALISAALVGVVGFAVIQNDNYLSQRFELAIQRFENPTGEQVAEESIYMRLALYKVAMNAILERPLSGYGRQNVMRVAWAGDAKNAPRFSYTHLHNGYLTDTVASGVLGLFSLLGVLLVPLFVLRNAQPIVFGGVLCVSVSYGLYGMTNLLFYHDVSTFLFLGLMCTFSALAMLPEPDSG
ncbi:O-antigen ligase family protein [Hoeflea sp. TYP-13]|uniref:O-antigen ligase family protein n=1 Tax=Hoeflea sp. TYP-13 TaxID=3230023 RepID=UPI0034C65630